MFFSRWGKSKKRKREKRVSSETETFPLDPRRCGLPPPLSTQAAVPVPAAAATSATPNGKKKVKTNSNISPSDEPAATRAPPSSRDQQHRSRLRSSECAAPTNAREHRSAGAKGLTSQQRSVPSLELERRCVGAAAEEEVEEGPGLSASEVTVSEWPASVSEGVEGLRRSLGCFFYIIFFRCRRFEGEDWLSQQRAVFALSSRRAQGRARGREGGGEAAGRRGRSSNRYLLRRRRRRRRVFFRQAFPPQP